MFIRSHRPQLGRLHTPSFAPLALIFIALALRDAAASAGPGDTVPTAPGGLTTLSLDEAIARSEAGSGIVRRARAERRLVAARYVGADILLPANPVLAVGAGARREDVAGVRDQGTSFAAHLEQTIEIAGQRGARRGQVDREVELASWRERVALAEVRARVRASYRGAQLADAQVRAARRRVALVEQLVDSIRARVAAGASSSVDLELARIEKGRAARERLAAELALSGAETGLRVLLDLEPGVSLSLSTPLAATGTASALAAIPLESLVTRARQQRAELKTLEASRDALDAELVRLRREATPNPTLFLDFQRDLPGQVFVGGGVAVPLPVWRTNQGERAINRGERERNGEETALVEREIAGEVERLFRAVKAHAEIVRASEAEVLPAAESAVDLITQGWQAGKFDLFRVIQASREASEARRSYLESLGALWEASISLQRAIGAP